MRTYRYYHLPENHFFRVYQILSHLMTSYFASRLVSILKIIRCRNQYWFALKISPVQ